MENIVCLDASPLIDYYRKKVKEKTFFFQLTTNYTGFVLPVTAHFEVLAGSNATQYLFWENIFSDLLIVPYQPYINETALCIIKQLEAKRKTIEYKDLLIAATALHYNYRLAVFNEKHIEGLHLITLSSFKI
jgi:tRNA(fMet)-specific endonuclease VapC